MNITRDIQTLSEFKQNASKLIKQLQETREPIILTVNGKPAAVLNDPDSYQTMVDRDDYLDSVRTLKKRLAKIGDYKNYPTQDEAFARLFERNGIEAPEIVSK